VPFLWATLIPVVASLLLGWITLMDAVEQDSFLWFLQNVSSRALFSAIPGTWMEVVDTSAFENINGPDDLTHALGTGTMYTAFLSAKMWIGALAGAAMIFAAIRLRRWRDEG
jgi:ABC-2 type transport system permease protein